MPAKIVVRFSPVIIKHLNMNNNNNNSGKMNTGFRKICEFTCYSTI